MKLSLKTTILRVLQHVEVGTGLRNARNRRRFGPDAPQAAMRLRIKPRDVKMGYLAKGNAGERIHNWQTGKVIGGSWDLSRVPFHKCVKFRSCRQHFRKGVPWTKTRAWPYGLRRIARFGRYDNCRSEADLIDRYALLDDLWSQVTRTGTLPAALHSKTTARTGILVHIDRNGQLLFGNQGFHRLAIAKLARVPELVVVVGIIHPKALETAAYKDLMKTRLS